MAKYLVKLKPVKGHPIPQLLEEFGVWLKTQEANSLGWFGLKTEKAEWTPEFNQRIQRDAFSFLHTADGSSLVLVSRGGKAPPAVGLLGSEGTTDTVANSLEEFLILLSNGETGVMDLDLEDDEAPGRKDLKSWLKKHKIKKPKAKPFDFDAFLDGSAAPAEKAPPPAKPSSSSAVPESVKSLPPFIRQLAQLVGRSAEDPELVEFVTGKLGQKIPNSTTDVSSSKNVSANKFGIELNFSHDIKNDKYPLVPKSTKSFVPYLGLVWLHPKIADPLPFGLKFKMSVADLTAVLGEPTGHIGSMQYRRPYWQRILDPARSVVLQVEPDSITIEIQQAMELTARWERRPHIGLLIGWLAQRDLLDPTAFSAHAVLLDAIRKRQAQGSRLLEAALPRGLWDVHLKDLPGFRHYLYEWMHNIDQKFINKDLISVFGRREGKHGHDEPVLDDDDWAAVDKVTPVLDQRFAEWVTAGKQKK